MVVVTRYIPIETGGDGEILDLTQSVQDHINSSGIYDGIVTIFTPSATSGITTLEFEPGCVKDFQRLFDEIIPPEQEYTHNLRWGDGNGHSPVRAGLIKPSLTVPITDGKMTLGIWQSIVLVDFDNRSRERKLVLKIIGE